MVNLRLCVFHFAVNFFSFSSQLIRQALKSVHFSLHFIQFCVEFFLCFGKLFTLNRGVPNSFMESIFPFFFQRFYLCLKLLYLLSSQVYFFSLFLYLFFGCVQHVPLCFKDISLFLKLICHLTSFLLYILTSFVQNLDLDLKCIFSFSQLTTLNFK